MVRIDPERLNAFGEALYEMMLERGIETQSELERFLAERGQEVDQRAISRQMAGAKVSTASARKYVRGMELTPLEQIELAWATLYDERLPGEALRQIQEARRRYEQMLDTEHAGNKEGARSHFESSDTTSAPPSADPGTSAG